MISNSIKRFDRNTLSQRMAIWSMLSHSVITVKNDWNCTSRSDPVNHLLSNTLGAYFYNKALNKWVNSTCYPFSNIFPKPIFFEKRKYLRIDIVKSKLQFVNLFRTAVMWLKPDRYPSSENSAAAFTKHSRNWDFSESESQSGNVRWMSASIQMTLD